MVIRELQSTDLQEFFALLTAKAKFDGAESICVATVENLERVFFGERPSAYALVAEAEGRVVAMATYYTVFSLYLVKPSIWLNDLFVHPGWRGNRIGKQLLVRLAQIAIDKDCARIDWIVAVANAKGQEFYRRLGAQIFDTVRLARFNETAIRELASAPA